MEGAYSNSPTMTFTVLNLPYVALHIQGCKCMDCLFGLFFRLLLEE